MWFCDSLWCVLENSRHDLMHCFPNRPNGSQWQPRTYLKTTAAASKTYKPITVIFHFVILVHCMLVLGPFWKVKESSTKWTVYLQPNASLPQWLSVFPHFLFHYWAVFLSECGHVLENQRVEKRVIKTELINHLNWLLKCISQSLPLSFSFSLSIHWVRWVEFNGFLMLRCMRSKSRKEWRVEGRQKSPADEFVWSTVQGRLLPIMKALKQFQMNFSPLFFLLHTLSFCLPLY